MAGIFARVISGMVKRETQGCTTRQSRNPNAFDTNSTNLHELLKFVPVRAIRVKEFAQLSQALMDSSAKRRGLEPRNTRNTRNLFCHKIREDHIEEPGLHFPALCTAILKSFVFLTTLSVRVLAAFVSSRFPLFSPVQKSVFICVHPWLEAWVAAPPLCDLCVPCG